jgi:leader peptidase (prepilin peptidase)/N-methyltransferase
MLLTITFIFGIVIGSFLNVCICRLPKKESVVFPGSYCPACGYQLKAWDLVPLVSFILLKGRCRRCGAGIPWRYPLIEFLTGVLFVLIMHKYGTSGQAVFYCILASVLVVISFIDLEHYLIPNQLVLLLLGVGLVFHMVVQPFSIWQALLTFFGAGVFFLVLQTLSGGGLGSGDIKLVAVLGLWLGWPDTALAIFLGSLAGSIVGIALIVSKKKVRENPIAYGPYLALGTMAVLVVGDLIWHWYLNLIF